MTAKEYLGQAYRLDQHINTKLQQIDSLRSLTQKVTASYDGEVVSHTRNVHSLQDAILHLMEAEEELNHQIDELVRTKVEIGATIHAFIQ
jgi:predicted  nucleic acid-binding Zn-ribbon protein